MAKTLKQAEEEARNIVNRRMAFATGFGWIPGSSLFLGITDYGYV